ncbi:LysR family transcriptional regulator [Bradyrhizobium canariense]|uniref:LysR family transcriptional regulator n=1 Tax=Bradyrhizobium canariense TaxID=255045 RepID=UPI000A195220|nr:LysR family transcriptional regulator [Bradyrhizobium canariense]OSI20525.1 LysR family transcriptional regulator [Bradyrhizobium canariense]OSI33443.1 LysR family transcriptional regulator [Bradyrhizobium canariense]OSI39663.1 LysR family transcriptional regulator [Bradyrhizobium canariense]OSI47686.1 LysR family transcriptional regulator [Bradyrhizobium canariense]OSI56030.1 LysR family transcriptional regulator [Bradyrhizobium canariense]
MSFNKLDLNLLRVFDAVMEERSVLRASQRMCLSPTAVSHALARLRELLDDELFIRTTTGMRPTARSLAMAPLIREAWKSLKAAVDTPTFVPRESTRRFTIAVSDFVTTVMVPNLLALLRREAPLVDLVIRPASWIDIAEQMDLGQIDAAIGIFSDVPVRFRASSLFAYDDVLIASSSGQLDELSVETFSDLSIAVVSLHGEHEGIVDGFVSERGLARRSEMFDRAALERIFSLSSRSPRVAVSLPHFLALPTLLEDTDLAAIVPRPLAKLLVRRHPISMYELPYQTASEEVSVLWPERNGDNAPQDWLRGVLTRAAEPLRCCSGSVRASSFVHRSRTA